MILRTVHLVYEISNTTTTGHVLMLEKKKKHLDNNCLAIKSSKCIKVQ